MQKLSSFQARLKADASLLELRSPGSLAPNADNPVTVSPDVALSLDLVWTEPAAVAKQSGGQRADKVFLAEDTVGDSYICFQHAANSTLAVVKFEVKPAKEEGRPPKTFFGAVNHVPAVDAEPVPDLKMTLVLEPAVAQQPHPTAAPALSLYSGLLKVARVIYDVTALHLQCFNRRIGNACLTQQRSLNFQHVALEEESSDRAEQIRAGSQRGRIRTRAPVHQC